MMPMMINVENRTAVIIGGGKVAYRRAKILREHNAHVVVVSPTVIDELNAMKERSEIVWKKKGFEPEDIQEAFVVVAATNDHKENERIASHAVNIPLLNRADGGKGGNLHFPSHFSRGKLTVAISTNGASPKLSSRLIKDIENLYPADYKHYVDFLYECRQLLKQSGLSKEVQHEFLEKIIDDSYQDPALQQRMIAEIHMAREEREGK